MTKTVRIENADGSDHQVVVEVWEARADGAHVLVDTKPLNYPTAMLSETIWQGKYLIVKEKSN